MLIQNSIDIFAGWCFIQSENAQNPDYLLHSIRRRFSTVISFPEIGTSFILFIVINMIYRLRMNISPGCFGEYVV